MLFRRFTKVIFLATMGNLFFKIATEITLATEITQYKSFFTNVLPPNEIGRL